MSDHHVSNQISHDYGYKEGEGSIGDGDNDVELTLMMVASGVVGHHNSMAKVSCKLIKSFCFPL